MSRSYNFSPQSDFMAGSGTALEFLASFQEMKVGLSNHQSVYMCVSVCVCVCVCLCVPQ
jgi:hypothetical protein